jgi:arylformamidase
MTRIVDLSMAIEDHFRWPVERSRKGDLEAGDAFQVTRLGWVVHGFTHVDAPRHMVAGGDTTCWETVHSPETPEFWTESPYLSAAACRWLLECRIKALGVDFPQDYPIRGLLGGEQAPITEFVSHDILLRNGVILIEYLTNLGALEGPRTTLFALPLKVPNADGAPARVIAYAP